MAYKIKLCNSKGTMYSCKYKTKAEAMRVIKANRKADTKTNAAGYRAASTGRLIRIKNKYRLVKV